MATLVKSISNAPITLIVTNVCTCTLYLIELIMGLILVSIKHLYGYDLTYAIHLLQMVIRKLIQYEFLVFNCYYGCTNNWIFMDLSIEISICCKIVKNVFLNMWVR